MMMSILNFAKYTKFLNLVWRVYDKGIEKRKKKLVWNKEKQFLLKTTYTKS